MRNSLRTSIVLFTLLQSGALAAEKPLEYAKQIAPIFKRYCNGCHNVKEAEGKLVLSSFTGLMKGGEKGKVIQPGNAAKSRLIGMVEHKIKPFMPPEGNKGPSVRDIALLKAWINAGAKKPSGGSPAVGNLITPKIKPVGKVRRPIAAVVYSPDGKWVAVARHRLVEIRNARSLRTVRKLSGHAGNVTGFVFSRDGKRLFVASGEPGLSGEATIWNAVNWTRTVTVTGHSDSLYAIAVSPDGRVLATGSYDRTIILWDAVTGRKLRTLKGHNGPVNDLAFHRSGKILASASGDRTVKLWNVATGARLDTLGQPVKGQSTVAFSPDGRFVVAGGVDNRVRVWEITGTGKEGTNPLIYSRFAHEAPILKLVFSPDGKRLISSGEDRTVKIWETRKFTQLAVLKNQSDWATALAVSPQLHTLLIGRMDGSLTRYPFETTSRLQSGEVRPVALTPTPHSPHGKPALKMSVRRETEPNDTPKQAQRLSVPGTVAGVLKPSHGRSSDVDLYRFSSAAGRTWILETRAARDKSPADTKIEILHADGRPVLRYLLRAVRDSYITFRPIDSRQTQVRLMNWQEMQLNQYLYMGGEIGKLFRAPRGPDSGFGFYEHAGKRRCYFGSSATVHAKDDPVYIVEPFPPGTELVESGLPVFRLYYANDDDGERKRGSDSRLTFTAPASGDYLVRVSDVTGLSGDRFKYSLSIREAQPDFHPTISGKNSTVAAGSGQRLTVKLDRIDGFNGEVRIHVSGLPRGFQVTSPIIIQPGHLQARGVLHVADFVTPTLKSQPKKKPKSQPEKKPKKKSEQKPKRGKSAPARRSVAARKPVDWSRVRITATAWLNGRKVTKTLGTLGRIKVAVRPSVIVKLEVDPQASANSHSGRTRELTIVPGTTTTAILSIERNGYKGELKFDVDHLPHGVIVDNIGLSGILIRAGENRRRVYLTAAKWVPETVHEIDAVSLGRGNQASAPIRLRVLRNR